MNIGFVSSRFSGTDGVSLESRKWAEVLERSGHSTFWFCGLSDHPRESTFLVPEAHFLDPAIETISETIWNRDSLATPTVDEIERLRELLRAALGDFRDRFSLDLLIVENAVTIPMNLPLGLAIADFIEETPIPSLAHHHDFYWERDRFVGEATRPYLDRAFPPRLPGLAHSVIHSAAGKELRSRFGLSATLVPNVMDFESAPPRTRYGEREIRSALGLDEGDRILLQPTRVIPRKGIEHAIELASRLGEARNKLIVSHDAGDEGLEYRRTLENLASEKDVDLRFVSDRVAIHSDEGEEIRFALEEIYPLADFVTFPSLYEGFGNALLEAVYFRKPLLVNRYPVFRSDIEGCGMDFVTMDGSITDEVVARVAGILARPVAFRPSAERNFRIASEHFGYRTLRQRLSSLFEELGMEL